MAYITPKEQIRFIESSGFTIDYNEGDILMLDSVKDISPLFPLDPKTILFAVCNSGNLTIEVEGRDYTFKEGSVMCCPPKLRVTTKEHSKDFDCKVLYVSYHIVRGLLRDKADVWKYEPNIRQLSIAETTPNGYNELSFYLTIIRSKLKAVSPYASNEVLLALLRAFLLELYFLMHANDGWRHEHRLSQGKVLFNRFLALISSSEVKRQPISVYASQLAITPKYLTMLCLKYSNKTASEWVAQYTVEEIRFYLKNTELSIKEISARLGFTNMSHFGSYVRKHFGKSPSDYRYDKNR